MTALIKMQQRKLFERSFIVFKQQKCDCVTSSWKFVVCQLNVWYNTKKGGKGEDYVSGWRKE